MSRVFVVGRSRCLKRESTIYGTFCNFSLFATLTQNVLMLLWLFFLLYHFSKETFLMTFLSYVINYYNYYCYYDYYLFFSSEGLLLEDIGVFLRTLWKAAAAARGAVRAGPAAGQERGGPGRGGGRPGTARPGRAAPRDI